MWRETKNISDMLQQETWVLTDPPDGEFWTQVVEWFQEHMLPQFLSQLTHQVQEIIEIDPDLSEREILESVASSVVGFLGARHASVRIYDPLTEQMLSYGSFPSGEQSRVRYIPLENSIAGEVVKHNRPYVVPNIMKEDLYLDKTITQRQGANSLMAIPLDIPSFFSHDRHRVGVIQIYYPEIDRLFSPLEIQIAEIMSQRLSFVIARKKILVMHKVNEKKDTIARKIFMKRGTGEGIKMKEVFNRVIPELVDIINLQSCALFSVSDDLEQVIIEAGYPDSLEYHGIGKKFSVNSEPAFELVLGLRDVPEISPYEIVTQAYVLIIDPQKSTLISENLKKVATTRHVSSILYVPLNVGEEITHFMTFDAIEQRQGYLPEEIEIFLFLGRELMKAQRMERLDDLLHDFKNPAIATAGFARRLKQLIAKELPLKEEIRIKKYIDILFEETCRLQEMALSVSHVGKEQLVNVTEVLRRRFEINKEAIKEQMKQNVHLTEGPFLDEFLLKCHPLQLERVFDNLLNNATKAIPLQGGELSIRSYREGAWGCVEIKNSGTMSEAERQRLIEGEGEGRGLYITHRIIRLLKGQLKITVGKQTTTVIVNLQPLHAHAP